MCFYLLFQANKVINNSYGLISSNDSKENQIHLRREIVTNENMLLANTRSNYELRRDGRHRRNTSTPITGKKTD